MGATTSSERILSSACAALARQGTLTDARAKAFAETFAISARFYARYGEGAKARRYQALAKGMHPSGGMSAFGRVYRMANGLLGPMVTERIVGVERLFLGRRRKGPA